jgi:L-threonylcarbamoyladenylate synthase
MNKDIIFNAIQILRSGGVIAYPTEAVFGLGCDPFNQIAVQKILHLKHRTIKKGLILIISKWKQAANLVAPISSALLAKIFVSQPPTTWIFPATLAVPSWIVGSHNSVALRIIKHPIAMALCDAYEAPIVSTSANINGIAPARTAVEVQNYFPKGIDFIIDGPIGNLTQPTMIRDVITGRILRDF